MGGALQGHHEEELRLCHLRCRRSLRWRTGGGLWSSQAVGDEQCWAILGNLVEGRRGSTVYTEEASAIYETSFTRLTCNRGEGVSGGYWSCDCPSFLWLWIYP